MLAKPGKRNIVGRLLLDFKKNRFKYFIILPVLIFLIIFAYKPMYGIIIAFKNYRPSRSISESEWVGLRYFKQFVQDPYFLRTIRNTFAINILQIIFGFPVPIIFAILLNEIKVSWFKRTIQTVSYMPHFISTVVICGMVTNFCASGGLINDIIALFGGERQNLLVQPELFYPIYILAENWQTTGWSSIIYLAALTGIDQEQYEAAQIDGASRIQQMCHITLPGLIPTVSMMLILRIGSILGGGGEKILLLYKPLTYEVADVISTYVYRRGIIDANYSYSTAISLFNSLVNIAFLVAANKISKKAGQSGLF